MTKEQAAGTEAACRVTTTVRDETAAELEMEIAEDPNRGPAQMPAGAMELSPAGAASNAGAGEALANLPAVTSIIDEEQVTAGGRMLLSHRR